MIIIFDGFSQSVVDAASPADCRHDGAEVVMEQHNRGGFAGDFGPPSTHDNADVGRLP